MCSRQACFVNGIVHSSGEYGIVLLMSEQYRSRNRLVEST